MRKVVRRGTAIATPEFAHTIHAQVSGLEPNRWYWYQFKAGNEVSRIGRTRTAPAPGESINELKFAFASCQDWQNGYYAAYRDMAAADLDLVVFLGDYIYEYGAEANAPRQHLLPREVFSLEDYRNLHALYKSDSNLQDAHAAFPWIVTWDDHEFENNYANLTPEETSEQFGNPQAFLERRINAYKAYYEHMPLRGAARPKGADLRLYQRFTFGDLAQFSVLDTRQYRTDQPCEDGLKPRCPAALDPAATMTGAEQEKWLFEGLGRSPACWNVLAQQTIFGQVDFDPRPEPFSVFNVDQWDGYVVQRQRIIDFLQERKVSNPVIITGDIHSSWVHDIKANFDNPTSATVATEFVGTSIASDFPSQFIAPVQAALPANPHIKFFDGAFRGYVRCKLTKKDWQTEYRAVASVRDPNSAVNTLARFVVENGQPGAQRVS
jgi:alkaline phosphatase D